MIDHPRPAKPPSHLFVLSGAGLSAESGLKTFRDADGLWRQRDPMQLATPHAFAEEPRTVLEFYNERRRLAAAASPNLAHEALARLARERAGSRLRTTLCTQNVDGLLTRAGARDVLDMHGSLFRARCGACGKVHEQTADMAAREICRECGAAGVMRPDIVWFGEVPHFLDQIEQALMACDLFVAIGTSAAVYPAAGFVALAAAHGARTLEINLEPSDRADAFDDHLYGPASQIVPAWVEGILGR